MSEDRPVDRRGFLKAVGVTGALAGTSATQLAPTPAQPSLPQAPLPIPPNQHQMLGGGWATWCCPGRGM